MVPLEEQDQGQDAGALSRGLVCAGRGARLDVGLAVILVRGTLQLYIYHSFSPPPRPVHWVLQTKWEEHLAQQLDSAGLKRSHFSEEWKWAADQHIVG